MLRITTCKDYGITRFVVEGKLVRECISELDRCWQEARDLEGSILVDLTGVTFVDQSGKQLLRRMHDEGAGFLGAGLMTKCLIEEIKKGESNSARQKEFEL